MRREKLFQKRHPFLLSSDQILLARPVLRGTARFPRIDCSARGFLRFRGGKGIMGWGISRKKGKAEYAK